jgi:hypothetical protein
VRNALAPAGDVGTLVGREHIARLRRRGGIAGDDVDAIHAHHREDAAVAGVAHTDRVFVARLADDIAAALVPVDRQHAAFAAIDDFDRRLRLRTNDVRAAVARQRQCGGAQRDHERRQSPSCHMVRSFRRG